MKKFFALAAIGSLALSSCTLVGNPVKKDVTGQLRGFNPDQNLRLAIVGYNNGQYTADGTPAQVIDKFLTGGFVLDLPTKVPYGSYRVIVFRDANDNNRYDIGDTVLSRHNGKLLLYTSVNDQYFVGTVRGWNIYDANSGKIQTTVLNNYDLQAQ